MYACFNRLIATFYVLWNFVTPRIHISGTAETRKFKNHEEHWQTKWKVRSNGSGRGHVTYFCNFGTPSMSLELLKLETSNWACI